MVTTLFDRAVQDIGKYYGIPDKDAKQSFLKRMTDLEGEKEKAFKEYVNPGPIDDLIGQMQDRSSPGPGVRDIIAEIAQLTVAKGDDDDSTNINGAIRVCFESAAGATGPSGTAAGAAGASYASTTGMAVMPDPSGDMQGGRGLPDGVVSIRTMLDLGDDDDLNTPTGPTLSMIQINSCGKTPVSRGTGAVAVFMNGIPTLEWSRCIPRLDITIVSDFKPLSNDNRLVAMGTVQDLLGNVQFGDMEGKLATQDPRFMLGTAVDVRALEDLQQVLAAQQAGKPASEIFAAWTTTGMEMFLTPQTLSSGQPYVNYADVMDLKSPNAADPAAGAETADDVTPPGGGNRPIGVLDRFRPLAGIQEFKVSVHTGPGFISWKTAELELTCYDRSRLYILAPIIKPDRYGKTKLIIDYGWSHTGGGPADPNVALLSTLGGSGLQNPYATFLNGMNRREVFVVTNCGYQFENDGTVRISVSLSTQGGDRLNSLTIAQGPKKLQKQRTAIEDIVKAVNEMRQKIMGSDNASAKAVVQPVFMNSVATADRALSMNADTKKKLKEFLGQSSENKDIQALIDLINDLIGGSSNALATYKSTINSAISSKKALAKTKDPWCRDFPQSARSWVKPLPSRRKNEYISFGKIFLHYVAHPLATSGDFGEVQVFFYGLNAKASFVNEFNIAQYPVNRSRFDKEFAKLATSGLDMPLSKFMGFMRRTFISQLADFPYGFNAMYTMGEDGFELSKSYRKKKAKESVVNNNMQKALKAAYKSDGKDVPEEELIFRGPKIAFHVEAVPLRAREGDPTDKPPKTLLRIHIYDSQNSGHTAERQLLRAAVDNQLGMVGNFAGAMNEQGKWDGDHVKVFKEGIEKAYAAGIIQATKKDAFVDGKLKDITKSQYMLKTNFAAIKKFVSYNIPTFTFGSNASSVLGAGLTTQQNDLLAAMSMAKAAGNDPTAAPGAPAGAPPMQLMPTKLTLETLGCPLVEVGQEYFMDFGTGTSMDNVYSVISATHQISAGKFTTDIELINQEAYGQWTTTSDILEKAKIQLEYLDAQKAKGTPAAQ